MHSRQNVPSRFVILASAIALVVLMSLSVSPRPAKALTFDLTGQCGDEAAFIQAITDANATPAADEIILRSNCVYDFMSANNTVGVVGNALPVITNPLTITGNDSSLTNMSEQNDFRFIYTSANLTITDLKIFDGVGFEGGAIAFMGGTSTVTGSMFNDNTAGHGGAVYVHTGATVTFNSTSFTGNFSTGISVGCGGGAIYSIGTLFVLEESTFTENEALVEGGAICNLGNATIEDSTFTENESNDQVGGAIASSGSLTIRDSVLRDNTAKHSGGAVYQSGTLILESSTFDNNQSVQGSGGALAAFGTAEIRDSVFADNTSGGRGGAIYGATVELSMERVSLDDNDADDDGGGISMALSSLDLTDSLVRDNRSPRGGGLHAYESSVKVTNSTFTYNDADDSSAIYSSAGISTTHEFTHITVTENYGSNWAVQVPASAVIKNSVIAGHTGHDDCSGSAATFTGSIDSDGTCGASTTHAIGTIGLQALADNGGPTQTRRITQASVAANAGVAGDCAATDQRGFTRPAGQCSAGAFEAFELPVVTFTGVSSNGVYNYSSVPVAGCQTTGINGTVATISVQPVNEFVVNAVCSGATAVDGTEVPLIVAVYYINYPQPTVTVTGVTPNTVYTYPNVPTPGCTTVDAGGGVGSLATLQVTGDVFPATFTATCDGATNILDYPAPPVSVTYSVDIPLAGVAITGVIDGATYVFATQPTPGCTTSDNGGSISAYATLTKVGTAPGQVTVTCAGAKNGAGLETPPISATYTVVCSRASRYEGLVNTKVGAISRGSQMVRVDLTFHPTTCELTGLVMTPLTPAGPAQVTTAVAWKITKLAVQQWRFTNNTISAATGGFLNNGQMRAMDKTSTLTAKLVNDTNGFYLKLTGMAPTGVGIGRAAFEIESGATGLSGVQEN